MGRHRKYTTPEALEERRRKYLAWRREWYRRMKQDPERLERYRQYHRDWQRGKYWKVKMEKEENG